MNVVKMWRRLLFLLPIIISVTSIKVPVDNAETATELVIQTEDEPQRRPVYYIKEDANVDSYLVPPDPHKLEEELPEGLDSPATYLIPPVKERQADFYIEPSAQSDWLPMLDTVQNKRNVRFQRLPLESIPIFLNSDRPEEANLPIPLPVPSTQLHPPSVDAVNEFFIPTDPEETEIEIHVNENNQPIPVPKYNLPFIHYDRNKVHPVFDPVEPTLALHLAPPTQQPIKPSTNLYPKKYPRFFKPVPLPLDQYSEEKEETEEQVPKGKPIKYFNPPASGELVQFEPIDEKKLYNFKKAENKRKLVEKKESDKQHESEPEAVETHGGSTSAEQETSETNFRYPGQNRYPPLRQPAPSGDSNAIVVPASDGRTEFRMHGMKGPHSYQFGYDTGKGKNRQFRYEERDNEGLVHGHYGYVDKLGKLRVVNYSAHPQYGFRAEEPVEKE